MGYGPRVFSDVQGAPTRRLAILAAVSVLTFAACSGNSTESAGSALELETEPDPLEVVVQDTTLVGGDSIEFALVLPDGYVEGEPSPVLLAMPPGGQDLDLTTRLVEQTWIEAARRGWVVVSPAAPNGTLYFQGSEGLLEEFLDQVAGTFPPSSGRLDLVGISNGGLSSFRAAALMPERFRTITVAPGFAQSEDDLAALEQLAEQDVVVAIFVGEGDSDSWIDGGRETVDALTGFGGRASLTIVEGEGHVITDFADGVRYLDTIEAGIG